jgi:hypothetical protein
MKDRDYTQQEREILRCLLPMPQAPVPINTEYFPDLVTHIRGTTSALPSKLFQLEHYYLFPAADAMAKEYAFRPESIGLDGRMALGMFQAFGRDFSAPQDMLAITSGSISPLYWEGTNLGLALNVHQFQTARFNQKNYSIATDEKSALAYLGFFDWRRVMLDFYKQSLIRLKDLNKPLPQFLAVPLMGQPQERSLREAMRSQQSHEELLMLEQKLNQEQANWLGSQGFTFPGRCPMDCMFMDIRNIEKNENFQKLFDPKPASARAMPLP